jgi:hypothetical protein
VGLGEFVIAGLTRNLWIPGQARDDKPTNREMGCG